MSGLRRRIAVVAVTLVSVGLAAPLPAREFNSFVEVESEEDINDLLDDGTIDSDGREELIELLETGVDLSTASRNKLYSLPNLTFPVVDAILLYRTEAGGLEDPTALVHAGLITERELFAMAPFLVVSSRKGAAFGAKGWVRLSTMALAGEARAPTMRLQARAEAPGGFRAGVGTIVTRDRLGRVTYDFARDDLTARPTSARVQLAKAFVEWQQDDFGLIAGTYKIGFGQRLTFDNTGDYAPNGFEKDDTIDRGSDLKSECRLSTGELSSTPCPTSPSSTQDSHSGAKVMPDYRWTPRLLGIAGGHRRIDLGMGHLQAFGFASYQRRAVYQNYVLDRRSCSIEDEAADNCDITNDFNIYQTQDNSSAQAPEYKWMTLPGLYDELVLGGNVAYWFGERARVGLTAYGAAPFWRISEMDLDFRRSARQPYGGAWGAVGINGTVGFAWWDLGMEVTRSIDSMSLGGGGFAAIARGTGSWKKRELELVLRYYGADFANPYARPISADDQYDGLRARDEVGGRVRFSGKVLRDLELRGTSDLWATPSVGSLHTQNEVRATYQLADAIRLSAWGLHKDKNLAISGREQCFTDGGVFSENPDATFLDDRCAGMKLQLTGQVRYEPFRKTAITLQYKNAWLDNSGLDDQFRQDRSFWLIVMVKPIDDLRIKARLRYLHERVDDDTKLERFVKSYLELTYNFQKRLKVAARYDFVIWTDNRTNTEFKDPNPEHWFQLSLEAKF